MMHKNALVDLRQKTVWLRENRKRFEIDRER